MNLSQKELNVIDEHISEVLQDSAELVFNVQGNLFEVLKQVVDNIKIKYPTLDLSIEPSGSFATQTNYANYEPLEFFVVNKSDQMTLQQDLLNMNKKKKKKKKSSIYADITGSSNYSNVLTNTDIAVIVMHELKKYCPTTVKLASINGTIKVKFEEEKLFSNITLAYKTDNTDTIHFVKKPYVFSLNNRSYINNTLKKEMETKGIFSYLCRFIKFVEIEFIVLNKSETFYSLLSGFSENILYNMPNNLFVENKLQSINNMLNFLKFADYTKFILADDSNRLMFETNDYKINAVKLLLEKLVYFYNNFDLMYLNQQN